MKFFNKQRYSLSKGSGLAKYLSYAIGEVILVVIGILIALAINNWNEQRKAEDRTLTLKARVLKQVDSDLEVMQRYRINLDTLQQEYLKVLEKAHDSSLTRFGSRVASLILQVEVLEVDNSTINMIDNVYLEDNEVARELNDMSGLYKLYFKDMKAVETIVFDAMVENLKTLERTEAWYPDFITNFNCSDECIAYLLNNSELKARIASLRYFLIDGYGGTVDDFYYDLKVSRDELYNTTLDN
ncbi:DUF6090 family protein [Sediminibacter sp. Hel_I_10]|uniref:DUF6090 family protein n=1 Tax=Sediminibacter sp. Hel_I_10 TaxID=1392490 RepID=UPI00047EF58B|nr:DUF6090 family protein [Sediminibacter sp. Hel_I_10]